MSDDRQTRPVTQSLKEFARGIAGGLLFSVPMIYTLEIWRTGMQARPLALIAYVLVTLLLLLIYNRVAGMHPSATLFEVFVDSMEEMGIGIVLATLMLAMVGQITLEMPLSEIVGKIVVESMTIAVGVSVGTAQLGLNSDDDQDIIKHSSASNNSIQEEEMRPGSLAQLAIAFCGAVLFAANVGPTDEVMVIATRASPVMLLCLALFTLALGSVILRFSSFVGSDRLVGTGGIGLTLLGIVGSYAASLLASFLTLWFFQDIASDSLANVVAACVVLAFPAMLGASAGRLLIQ